MDHHKRAALIAKYKDGYREVAAALEGASDKELDARPAPGKWTAREIVHHLADSEMTSAIRLRLLVAEERAAIRPYDEKAVRGPPALRSADCELAAGVSRGAPLDSGELLDHDDRRRLCEERAHTRSMRSYGVERWLEIYAEHAHNHADQIRRARASAA